MRKKSTVEEELKISRDTRRRGEEMRNSQIFAGKARPGPVWAMAIVCSLSFFEVPPFELLLRVLNRTYASFLDARRVSR